jgi:hypothetical protein
VGILIQAGNPHPSLPTFYLPFTYLFALFYLFIYLSTFISFLLFFSLFGCYLVVGGLLGGCRVAARRFVGRAISIYRVESFIATELH